MSSPKCRECKFKRDVPGDTHVSCVSPVLDEAKKSPVFTMLSLTNPSIVSNALGLKANPHGVKSGWCMFPLNYDPVWLEGTCKTFQSK
jgi:hypothetical protein